MSSALVARLSSRLRPGSTVALGDGAGALRRLTDGTSVGAAISAAARAVGSVRLLLGWMPRAPEGIEPDAFSEVIALMPGWGLRAVMRCPNARFVPSSVAGWPALLRGPLRPAVLVTRLVRGGRGLQFGAEVSYQRTLVDAGVEVLGVIDDTAPRASALPPIDDEQVRVVGYCDDGPAELSGKAPDSTDDALADAVLKFIPAGARLQYGPGSVGTALLRRAQVPLRIDTGMLTDAVVDLDRRGLLEGTPSATYLAGTDKLYRWADDRAILRGIEFTHDQTRLAHDDGPFIAVNTAVEIDPVGQVNVEGIGADVIGGIGGHPDFCAAARISHGGLSIIAVRSATGRAPLVPELSRPVSTSAHTIDLIVTESGHVDLRTADWSERRKLVADLFSTARSHINAGT
ncbi:acetyl-CoA hydrolase [Mycolicibacterium pulveris]|uniref:Acetyl-CoA hydrolase/transferase C-terminal domain-containing protein n=1 Tax=Mycolicibacterium pulveris TaxID=36813 RepID=A0A7I7UQJ4_MYCPV|nr:acetyl-CoA hydrolase/transferase C-terminal domain-containing protein [Mycolicibacterium pulveris]MCV6983851.1 acetyl-CoA hydrolase [Mycolicibacterium pulveris]BBY83735.1 hypothetical protein MPUL_48930 [Mycolicibacterium pulveris]